MGILIVGNFAAAGFLITFASEFRDNKNVDVAVANGVVPLR